MKKSVSAALCAVLALGACATHPRDISSTYVSPVAYSNYTCPQLGDEFRRVSLKVNEVTSNQQTRANNDALAFGVGMVVFWPALFFMANGDQKQELMRLKGEYDAIDQAGIEKGCLRNGFSRPPVRS